MAAEIEQEPSAKAHRERKSGPKADRKKKRNQSNDEGTAHRNPKAFTFQSSVRAARQFRRKLDVETKKHHVPLVDRTPLEPPPIVVAVIGPPKVGKTTLISSLLKNFTRQNLSSIKGPVTIVSGKKRRLTIIECGNDMNMMIDIAKIADLALLLIDASFGFEMEIFEFLNICQVHGFPKIMGVLTHLDLLKDNKSLKKTKKRLKNRFWTEVYQGAKLFYISGITHGHYPKTEVHNLGRFISVAKFRPLVWRTSHPYVLADRIRSIEIANFRSTPMIQLEWWSKRVHAFVGHDEVSEQQLFSDRIEDLTEGEELRQNPKCDRRVSFYGYVRGANIKTNNKIHLLGVGDFQVKEISMLPDPCPLPDKEKKRSLNEKERLLYAPMCGVGGVVYDKDAVYIDLRGSHHNKKRDNDDDDQFVVAPGNELLSSLSGMQETIDTKMASSKLSLFKGSAPLGNQEVASWKLPEEEIVKESNGRIRRKAKWDDGNEENVEEVTLKELDNEDEMDHADDENEGIYSDDEEIEDDEGDERVGEKLSYATRSSKTEEYKSLVYEDEDSDVDDEHVGDLMERESVNLEDVSDDEVGDTRDSAISDNALKKGDKIKKSSVIKNVNTKIGGKTTKRKSSGGDSMNLAESNLADTNTKRHKRLKSDEDEMSDGSSLRQSDREEETSQDKHEGKQYWSQNLVERAREAYLRHQNSTPNLKKLIYGQDTYLPDKESDTESSDNETLGGLFKMKNQLFRGKDRVMHERDCSRFVEEATMPWADLLDEVKDCFVTGKWAESEDAEALLWQDDENEDEMFGDFEDLETGEIHHGDDLSDGEKDDGNEGSEGEKAEDGENEVEGTDERLQKKKQLKAAFNANYDDGEDNAYYDELKAQMSEQARLNQEEFEGMDEEVRIQYEGYRAGMYVRVEVERVPCEFITNFDPTYPIILGGLLSNEDNIGYIQLRLKKHRWYKRILKTRDPLIMSIGWRRFQTITMYSMQDHNGRYRLLKYTPEHLHCVACAYGPIVPPGSGVLAVQSVADVGANFRIAATGVILDLDKSVDIVKKLKLTGTPCKIFKNTAFIKGMFNSALEVAKFEGASIRTVSGIRGQIKKAVKAPEGAFRATFEDKILMSDIAFVRCWYPVVVPKFYNPVTSLLISADDNSGWQGMKTVGQIRKQRGLDIPNQKDSLYKPIERAPRHFNPFVIPKHLQRDLPFKSKPKLHKKQKEPSLATRRAVVMEPDEKRAYSLMQQLYTANKEKLRKRKVKMAEKRAAYLKEKAKQDANRNAKQKENRKKIFRMLGQAEKRKQNRSEAS